MTARPLRLRIDRAALVHNWRALAALGGNAACAAAIKADGYGLGAQPVLEALAGAGCRDFLVATWAEAEALLPNADGLTLHVLHGLQPMDTVLPGVVPVLNSPAQVARWRAMSGGLCDLMFDTGMNRLGLAADDDVSGLQVDIAMSHLACAEVAEHPMNAQQRARFTAIEVKARRRSLANSAGIALGADYHFDLTRPGLALYGGVPCAALGSHIRPVVAREAAVVQLRAVAAGETVGYGAVWTAPRASRVAVLNIGYADGYLRGFSNAGSAHWQGTTCPVVGRVSMDLTAIDMTDAPEAREGDWVQLESDLPRAAMQSGLSQYELLTTLGGRYDRSYL